MHLAQLEEIDAACHAVELSNANGKLVLLKAVGGDFKEVGVFWDLFQVLGTSKNIY